MLQILVLKVFGNTFAISKALWRWVVMIENGSPKPLISHFQLKKSHYFPRFSAVCGSIFKNKIRIWSSGISVIQKCQKTSKKLAKK